jgi:DNA repair protein RecO (recombination protein O)
MSLDLTAPQILKTDAIALRIAPFSRTSHVVTWLSAEFGRITTVVKGACRPKSAFLGQYDLFYCCELLFYRHEHDGVHAIREVTPLDTREALRADWRRVVTASYLADLVSRVAQPAQESGDLYELLDETLVALCRAPPTLGTMLQFELSLLQHQGVLPGFALCPTCHTPTAAPWVRFAIGAGQVRCAHSTPSTAGESVLTVHREVLLQLQRLSQETQHYTAKAGDQGCAQEPLAPHLSLGLWRFLGIFIRSHLDTPPGPRRLALELLETDPARFGGATTGDS